jgi:hypothetical protein
MGKKPPHSQGRPKVSKAKGGSSFYQPLSEGMTGHGQSSVGRTVRRSQPDDGQACRRLKGWAV